MTRLVRQENTVTTTSSESGQTELPGILAIFPLPSAVLLPRQILPLNIFEPRYLSMVEDALRSGRHIGMIQPMLTGAASDPVPVYRIGCAGKITSFQETEDGRFLIQLTGVCRFRVAEEIFSEKRYRQVRPDWQPYLADLEDSPGSPMSLEELEKSLRGYLEVNGLKINWEMLRKLPPAHLVDFLTVNLPLEVEEKQALVELPSAAERAQVLRSTLEIAVNTTGAPNQRLH